MILGRWQNKADLQQEKLLTEGETSELHLTYRQKFFKADLFIVVAIKSLNDLSNHVSRFGTPNFFKHVMEFKVTDISIIVQI